MLDTRITAVVALPMVHVFSTQTVAEFYPRRAKPNLDKSEKMYVIDDCSPRSLHLIALDEYTTKSLPTFLLMAG